MSEFPAPLTVQDDCLTNDKDITWRDEDRWEGKPIQDLHRLMVAIHTGVMSRAPDSAQKRLNNSYDEMDETLDRWYRKARRTPRTALRISTDVLRDKDPRDEFMNALPTYTATLGDLMNLTFDVEVLLNKKDDDTIDVKYDIGLILKKIKELVKTGGKGAAEDIKTFLTCLHFGQQQNIDWLSSMLSRVGFSTSTTRNQTRSTVSDSTKKIALGAGAIAATAFAPSSLQSLTGWSAALIASLATLACILNPDEG